MLCVNKIQVFNCEIKIASIETIAELKKEIAESLNVKPSDIHFSYEEIQE